MKAELKDTGCVKFLTITHNETINDEVIEKLWSFRFEEIDDYFLQLRCRIELINDLVDTINKTNETNENDYIQQRLDKLNALECAGVDNWDGYGYAMEYLNDEY